MATHRLFPLIATILLMSCSATKPAPVVDESDSVAFAEQYLVGIGDNLKVDVYRHPEISVSVMVRPDGKITVPVAGEILVGGQTPENVSVKITESLSEYIRSPIVTTTVEGMGSNEYLSRIRVTGAVTSPQSVPYRSGMTILDMVLEAGGLNDFSNPSKTVLYRKDGQRLKVRLDRILNKGDMSTNYRLLPGDIITVPERAF